MDSAFLSDQVLEELLDSDVSTPSFSGVVLKDTYRDLVRFRNVTSYSIQQLLFTCPRKFQLTKMEADLETEGTEQDGSNVDFAFGHAVGAGVACIDAGGSISEAVWQAFLSWGIDLLEVAPKKPNRPSPNKSFFHAVWAIMCYRTFREEETDLSEYDVVQNEATIGVDFEDGHYYVGHIDSLLKHRATSKYKVKENKTTVYSTVDPAQYSNSDQALSYALVVDQLGEAEYDVLYTIYSSTEQRWLQFEFTKGTVEKAEWLQSQFFVHAEVDQYEEINLFPKRGGSCLSFGRRCQFYENCGFNSEKVFRKRFSDLKTCNSLEDLSQIEKLDYSFKVSEIKARMKRVLE